MELGQDVNVKKRPRDVDDDEDSDVANTKNVKKEKHDDLCRVDKSTEDGNTTEHSSIETNLTLDSASKNERLLSEVDVGICEYIGSHCGFSGVIKQR